MKNEITKLLEKILGYSLNWYDAKDLDMNQRRRYKADAKMIIESDVFNNEFGHLIADIVKNTVLFSENFDQVQHARTSILQLEEFKKRLEFVEDPDTTAITTETINEAI